MNKKPQTVSILLTLTPLVGPGLWAGQDVLAASGGSNSACSHSDVRFDNSSVTAIVLHPDKVAQEPDAFWNTDRAYQLVASWHHYNNVPIPRSEWDNTISAFTKIPLARRKQSPPMRAAKGLMKEHTAFMQDALPHICSFLPGDRTDLDTTIYLTTETVPRAIQVGGYIVIDVANNYWQGSKSTILNTIVHEVFHVGYGSNECLRTEIELDDGKLNSLLGNLHNEGMATYVGYTARSLFPSPADQDYPLLERPSAVQRLVKRLNRLFESAESLSAERLKKKAWRLGVEQRAYYIVGAHMARTIDEKKGRQALVGTVVTGPRSFVSTYNSVADEGLRVFEFQPPSQLSLFQRLRKAAVDEDYDKFRNLLDEARSSHSERDPWTEERLIRIGRLLVQRGRPDVALEVFKVETEWFPDSATAFSMLCEAYMENGEPEPALSACQKALELDPHHIRASDTLRKLGQPTSDP
jgi:tetratricopeptide (TPR) repeat protein